MTLLITLNNSSGSTVQMKSNTTTHGMSLRYQFSMLYTVCVHSMLYTVCVHSMVYTVCVHSMCCVHCMCTQYVLCTLYVYTVCVVYIGVHTFKA